MLNSYRVVKCYNVSVTQKKGNESDPSNYRGITLVNCLTKIFNQIIHERIRKWAEENCLIPEEQAGFRAGWGCKDNVFNLLALLQFQARFKSVSAHALFVDLKRAFDSIPHNKLWQKLESLALSLKLLNLLVSLYNKVNIKNGGHFSGWDS